MSFFRTILSLCDFTGNWSAPYSEAGYRVIRVDKKIAINPRRPNSYDGDVRLLEYLGPVHGILAAPPCTMFASSGARWTRTEAEMLDALSIVDACLRFVAICKPAFWALENPVGKLSRYLGPPAMRFDPWWYGRVTGDDYTKRTCLWGNFNIPKRDAIQPRRGSAMHRLPPNENRAALRSVTPIGFARAFFEANP